MSRAAARINVILDALVELLSAIDGSPDAWLTNPKTVKRHSASPLAEPMPAVFIRCTRWGANQPQTGRQHDGEADIEIEVVTAYTELVDDPSRSLHSLCADVISAISTDWQLVATGITGLRIQVIDGYEPSVTLGNPKGYASTIIGFKAYWPWVAATP